MATKKTKSKKPAKRFLTKVHALTEKDIFKSIAITSILFNVLFLAVFLVVTNTSSFDRNIYSAVRSEYCKNIDAVKKRAEKLGDEKAALVEWHVTCISDEFAKYHEEAVTKFKANIEDSSKPKNTN